MGGFNAKVAPPYKKIKMLGNNDIVDTYLVKKDGEYRRLLIVNRKLIFYNLSNFFTYFMIHLNPLI
jgi:hypothetical protein